MKAFLSAVVLSLGLLFVSTQPASAFLDKTRFVAHLGVAYFCFHHWVLHPYQEGAFAEGAPHRTAAIVKGGLALLFAVHEVRVAQKIAANSPDPLLQKLNGMVTNMGSTFASVGEKLKSGHFNPQDVASLSSVTGVLGSAAAAGGAPIKDKAIVVPGV